MFASWVSGTVRPQDPGGGATPVTAPRRMMTNDVSDAAGLSGRGGVEPQLVPSRISVVLAGDTSRPESPCEDQEKQPLASTNKPPGGLCLRATLGRRAGGSMPPSVAAGGLLPVDVTDAPAMSVEGPRSVASRISVVLVDGWLGTLHDGSVHMRTGIGDRRLARRGRPVCL